MVRQEVITPSAIVYRCTVGRRPGARRARLPTPGGEKDEGAFLVDIISNLENLVKGLTQYFVVVRLNTAHSKGVNDEKVPANLWC